MLYACVLAGGRGERFWPLSRRDRPKQLTNLTGTGTMLRLTVERLLQRVPAERLLIVTSASLADRIRGELDFLPARNIIGEPVGRNSAPAIALAAHLCHLLDPDATLVVAPSDHVIDAEPYLEALDAAVGYVSKRDELLTFGVPPTRAETGYGYIERGDALEGAICRAVSFREKPDEETARHFLDEGMFLWNSGMFVWRADAILGALSRHVPVLERLRAELEIDRDGELTGASLESFYERAPSVSIDYGVMEKSSNVVVSTAAFGWCDVGSWAALGDVVTPDEAGNAIVGPVLGVDVKDSVFYTDGGPIAAIGLDGIVVVRVGEMTMICRKDQTERVRELVQALGMSVDWKRYL